MTDEGQIEILARLLCLACGENPDVITIRTLYGSNNRDMPISSDPLWKEKYFTTAKRFIQLGVVLDFNIKAILDKSK